MRHKPRTRAVKDVTLNITSMLDMLTALLFFLIMSFDPQGANVKVNKSLELPKSNSLRKYESQSSNLSMSREALFVEDKKVVELTDGEFNKLHLDGEKIIPLFEILEKKRKSIDEARKAVTEAKNLTAKTDEQKEDDDYTIYFAGDKNLSFKILNKIMLTAAMAGFPIFKFTVMPE